MSDKIAELQAEIERERKQRAEACLAEVQAALDRHRCRLVGEVLIVGDQVQSRVKVVPAE